VPLGGPARRTRVIEKSPDLVKAMAKRLVRARERLNSKKRQPRKNAPQVEAVYSTAEKEGHQIPESLKLMPGKATTLRGELGRVLEYYNKVSQGALFVGSADLLGSTSVNVGAKGFPEGYFNAVTNPLSRTLSLGGICEDAMSGILSGLASLAATSA